MKSASLHFCTLFDSNYLSRGLAMYKSLAHCCPDFHLYVFAFDEKCERILKQLSLPNLTVIALAEFEDDDLLKVKSTRSRAEYCWTCASSTILYCIEQYNLPHCTYLDADLYFYNNPAVLIEEMGDHSILITKHRYSPQYEKAVKAGIYCVQFITFKNDEYGLKALKWWRERCLEWCYARFEDGKFGDQKYLDDWTTRFEKVWVLKHLGGGLAAWNIQQYKVEMGNGGLQCIEIASGKKFLPVFYHFHYLRFYNNGSVELGRRELSKEVLSLFYKPYILELEKDKKNVNTLDPSFDPNGAGNPPKGIKHQLISFLRKMKNTYHIYELNRFLNFF